MKYRLHKAKLAYEAKYDIEARSTPTSAPILTAVTRESSSGSIRKGRRMCWKLEPRPDTLSSEMVKRGCVVTGIEQDPEMAKIAEKYCQRMIVGDVETLDLLELGTYDAIILGDVVEHLRNPT